LATQAAGKVLDRLGEDVEVQSFIHRVVFHSAQGDASEALRAVEEFMDGTIAGHFKEGGETNARE